MRLLLSVLIVLACAAATPRNVSGYPPGTPAPDHGDQYHWTYHERLAGVWLPSGEGGTPITFKLRIVSDVCAGTGFSGTFRCNPNRRTGPPPASCPTRFGKFTNITLTLRATTDPREFLLYDFDGDLTFPGTAVSCHLVGIAPFLTVVPFISGHATCHDGSSIVGVAAFAVARK